MEKLGETQKSMMDEIKIIHHPSPRNDHILMYIFPVFFLCINCYAHKISIIGPTLHILFELKNILCICSSILKSYSGSATN